MPWCYRIRKRQIPLFEGSEKKKNVFDIVEFFWDKKVPDPKKKKKFFRSWTADSIAPQATSKKELIGVLELMLRDAKCQKVIFDKKP